jgi:hercynylcysteine S-oxide lyase
MTASDDPFPAASETVLPVGSHKPPAPGSGVHSAGALPTQPGSVTLGKAMMPNEYLFPADRFVNVKPELSAAANGQTSNHVPPSSSSLTPASFGHAMRNTHFRFAPSHLPLNHGSYGLSPLYVHQALQDLYAEADYRPDPWMRYTMPAGQRKSREQVARLLHCPKDDVVLVPNASTATDCVLHNIEWQEGDVLIYYVGCYPALENAIFYTMERSPLKTVRLTVSWPITDDKLVSMFEDAIKQINSTPGQRVKMLVFDTIVSLPAQRVPWERLCEIAQKAGAWSLVDGAHGIGQIPLNLSSARPDFFATNLHKWLSVPRGCAAFYVHPDAQHLIRATLPISNGFVPRHGHATEDIINPLPGKSYGRLADLFDWVATIDYRPYLTVEAALEWREKACGGEEEIQRYCIDVAQRGADRTAEILGTEVMGCEGSSGRDCAMSNVLVPVQVEGKEETGGEGWATVKPEDAPKVTAYLQLASAKFEDSYFSIVCIGDSWWWRMSGQIYLEIGDFEQAAEKMKDLVRRVKEGKWLKEWEELNA